MGESEYEHEDQHGMMTWPRKQKWEMKNKNLLKIIFLFMYLCVYLILN